MFTQPMTIRSRVAVLRAAAEKGASNPEAAQFYRDTANVMEALAAQYNTLCAAALDTVRRSNGEDPAITILIEALREQNQLARPMPAPMRN